MTRSGAYPCGKTRGARPPHSAEACFVPRVLTKGGTFRASAESGARPAWCNVLGACQPMLERRVITHRFSLDQYGKALDALANDRTAHKIVLVP